MNLRLLTVAQAAEATGLSESFLTRGAAARSIPHTRVGRFVRFSEADLEELIAAGRVRPVRSVRRSA
jgi:excisionase family DNA binding protein